MGLKTYDSCVDHDGRDLGDQIYGPLVVDLLLKPSHVEPDVAGVGPVELLPGVGPLVVRHHAEAGAQVPGRGHSCGGPL